MLKKPSKTRGTAIIEGVLGLGWLEAGLELGVFF